jgi:carbon storage regulator CsrA
MLVITRKVNESVEIEINGKVVAKVYLVQSGKTVKIGIKAESSVRILRSELRVNADHARALT